MSAVRTVLGDLPADALGVCDAHDHLFLRSPRLPGEELDDPRAAAAELEAFAAAGGAALVQWTPLGMGRRRADLARLARGTGVHLVAATGLHQRDHYDPAFLDGVLPRLAEAFVADLTTGPVRAGLIKVAGAFHGLDAHARHVMTAAARAHRETGAPIAVHLEQGTAALETVDFLCREHGVPATSLILGHLGRFPDTRTHLQAAELGVFLAFDGPSQAHHATDWRLLDELAALVVAGHGRRLLLGADTVRASARHPDGTGPGAAHLLRSLRPRLTQELGHEAVANILVDNPGRAFAADWRSPSTAGAAGD